jgi:hypothetical protein
MQLTSDSHLDLFGSFIGVTLSHSLPIDIGSDCGPGGVKSEATIQVPEIIPAISVEFKFKALNFEWNSLADASVAKINVQVAIRVLSFGSTV